MMGADKGYVHTHIRPAIAGADELATAYALSKWVLKIGLPI
jgi:electron transfer flavoprotein alpha/beta subunit